VAEVRRYYTDGPLSLSLSSSSSLFLSLELLLGFSFTLLLSLSNFSLFPSLARVRKNGPRGKSHGKRIRRA